MSKTVFLRAIEADEKEAALLATIREGEAARRGERFDVDASEFRKVPRSPFAYWVSDRVRQLYQALPRFENGERVARQGGVNGDDFRWLRLWFEVSNPEAHGFVPVAKGGKFSRFYADLPLVAAWDLTHETFWAFTGLPHRPSLKPASFDFYFRPGLTWPRRTSGFSVRVLPAGCIFADKGPAAFVAGDGETDLLALACITNSRAFGLLVALQLARTELAQSYEVGLIQTTPVPVISANERGVLARLGRSAWSAMRSLDCYDETSHAFRGPALLNSPRTDVRSSLVHAKRLVTTIQGDVEIIQDEIDERCFTLYGIGDEDRGAITEGFSTIPTYDDDSEEGLEDDAIENSTELDERAFAAAFLSWCVGVIFGRFDVRVANQEKGRELEPEPFDRLPLCSPGMLTSIDGMPLSSPPPGYPISWPPEGVLVDAPGDVRDVEPRLRRLFQVTCGEDAEDAERVICSALAVNSLREWLRKPANFFADHLSRYSRSRRQGPIYWPLSTESGEFTIWLYIHRLTDQTLFLAVNELVEPKLREVEEAARRLRVKDNRTRAEETEWEALEDFARELIAFRDELLRIAAFWKPNLNDGVQITAAPLWKLFRLPKWQKTLKETWQKLERGDYDWAHLAYAIRPVEVREKCRTDKSLAIAHGLEELYVEPPASNRKKKRAAAAEEVNDALEFD